MVHRVSNRLANVKQIACTFIIVSTSGITVDLSFGHPGNSVIIEFPPVIQEPVKDIAVVMALLCISVVDQDSMQMIWNLLLIFVRLLNKRFKLAYLSLNFRDLILSGIFILVKNFESSLELLLRDVLALRLIYLPDDLEIIIVFYSFRRLIVNCVLWLERSFKNGLTLL